MSISIPLILKVHMTKSKLENIPYYSISTRRVLGILSLGTVAFQWNCALRCAISWLTERKAVLCRCTCNCFFCMRTYTVLLYPPCSTSKSTNASADSLDAETLQLFCCGNRVRNYMHYPIRLYTWEHLCISVNLRKKLITLVLNNDVSRSWLRT